MDGFPFTRPSKDTEPEKACSRIGLFMFAGDAKRPITKLRSSSCSTSGRFVFRKPTWVDSDQREASNSTSKDPMGVLLGMRPENRTSVPKAGAGGTPSGWKLLRPCERAALASEARLQCCAEKRRAGEQKIKWLRPWCVAYTSTGLLWERKQMAEKFYFYWTVNIWQDPYVLVHLPKSKIIHISQLYVGALTV